MRKFLLSALLASGLTFAGAGAYALEDQPQEPQSEEQMNQGTEIEQEAEDTGATEPSTTEQSATEEEQSQSQGEEYVVQEGDTLASIAKEKLGSEDQWQSIAEANGLENPDQLQVGQSLIIPSSDQMGSDKPTEPEETQPMEEEGATEQSAPAPEEEAPSQSY